MPFPHRRTRPVVNTATVVRRKPSLDFSVTGLVYCSMMMFMGLAAINSQANLLFGVFGLMIGILLISGVISRVVLQKISVVRVLPESAVVGEATTIVYELTNQKRFWPSLSMGVSELDGVEAFTRQPVAYMLHAASKMTASVPVDVVPKRRGLYVLNRFQLSTSFPFGFIKRAIEKHQEDKILIFPAMGRVDRKLLQMCRSAENTGPTMRPRRGGQDEFYGVKEHRQGENPRHIYWRRSARTGVMVSKEMTLVSPPKLLLLVDTFAGPLDDHTPERLADIERTIAMAASLANDALEAGLSIGVLAWRGEWVLIRPGRGKRHRRDVLAQLATLPSNTTQTSQTLLDESHDAMETGMTSVLITPRDVQLGLTEHVRNTMIVVSASATSQSQGRRWFEFNKEVDFSMCGSENRESRIEK